jgi:Cupin-like domain
MHAYVLLYHTQDDLFKHLGDSRPDYRWLIIGPARSGSSFHIDPNATSAWNAVLEGKKKWLLFPPHTKPPGIYASHDGLDLTAPVSTIEWYMNFYDSCTFSTAIDTPTAGASSSCDEAAISGTTAATVTSEDSECDKHCQLTAKHAKTAAGLHTTSNSSSNSKTKQSKRHSCSSNSGTNSKQQQQSAAAVVYGSMPVECIVQAGEVIFVPQGWWHCVINIEDSIAITQNFVSTTNLASVLQFLRQNPHNISGLPLHEREHLYDKFLTVLEESSECSDTVKATVAAERCKAAASVAVAAAAPQKAFVVHNSSSSGNTQQQQQQHESFSFGFDLDDE